MPDIGWGALQDKDTAKAATHLKAAVDANPPDSAKDLSLLYPLALVVLAANASGLSERDMVRGARRSSCTCCQRSWDRKVRTFAVCEVPRRR